MIQLQTFKTKIEFYYIVLYDIIIINLMSLTMLILFFIDVSY
jgi:hypothetical protein